MISDCTECGLELGQLFVFIDAGTRVCLDCAEQRTGTSNSTKPTRKTQTP